MKRPNNRPFPLRRFKDRCCFAAVIVLAYFSFVYDPETQDIFIWMGSYVIYHVLPILIGAGISLFITRKNVQPSEKWNKVLDFLNPIFVCAILNHFTLGIIPLAYKLTLKLTLKFCPTLVPVIAKPITWYLVSSSLFFLSTLGYLQIIWVKYQKIFGVRQIEHTLK